MSTGEIHLFADSKATEKFKRSTKTHEDPRRSSFFCVKIRAPWAPASWIVIFFDWPKADDAAKASLFNALDPTSAVTVETLSFWVRWWDPNYRRAPFLVAIDDQPVAPGSDGEWRWWYAPGRYRVALAIHSACSHPLNSALHRQVQNGVVQPGRALCRS